MKADFVVRWEDGRAHLLEGDILLVDNRWILHGRRASFLPRPSSLRANGRIERKSGDRLALRAK
jgi:hypothetical protein